MTGQTSASSAGATVRAGAWSLLTADQLADVLQLHVETVYRYVRTPEVDGGIPRYRVGARLRFDLDAVLRWMAAASCERDGMVAALTEDRSRA